MVANDGRAVVDGSTSRPWVTGVERRHGHIRTRIAGADASPARPLAQVRSAVALIALTAGLLLGVAVELAVARVRVGRAHRPVAQRLSRRPIAAPSGWQRYVLSPASATVAPVRVISATGDATLVSGRPGAMTLTYPPGGAAPVVVLDFGQEVGGIAAFDVSGVGQPTVLQAAFSEALYNLGPQGDGSVSTSFLANSGDPLTYESFPVLAPGRQASSEIQGGFRYVRLTLGSPGTVALSGVSVGFTPPLEKAGAYRGYFDSSSDLLNRIWYAGAYTINMVQITPGTPGFAPGLTNTEPMVVDGAKRDRAIYSGDLMIEGPTLHTVFGGAGDAYAQGDLSDLAMHPATNADLLTPATGTAQTPGPMPGICYGPYSRGCLFYSATYAMAFVTDLHTYFMNTGDAAFVRHVWPLVEREIAWEQSQVDPATGLFMTTSNDDDDWNTDAHQGEFTAASALYYASLADAATLATAIGATADATSYRALAAATRWAINAHLWDAKLGTYDASTTDRGFIVQDASVWPIAFGVASPAQAASILPRLASALATPYGLRTAAATAPGYTQLVSPYMGSFTALADFAGGRPDLGIALIEREWGWMIDHGPQGTDWEKIELPGGTLGRQTAGIGDSAAHGWSTGPTAALSEYILGIRPVTGGYRTWLIQPVPESLRWASGQVPAAAGVIVSRWARGAHDSSFRLTVSAPPGTSGTVAVPVLGAARIVYEDGHLVWNGSRGRDGSHASLHDGYVDFSGVQGTHNWAWVRAWRSMCRRRAAGTAASCAIRSVSG